MKDAVLFIKWWWARRTPTDVWTKVYFAGLFFSGVGIGSSNLWLSAMGVACFISGAVKWLVWEPITNSFKKFQEERANLFETIKDPK